MKRVLMTLSLFVFLNVCMYSVSFAKDFLLKSDHLLGAWEGTSKIASGFGFLEDKAIMEIQEINDNTFLGTLTALAPNGEHQPVIKPLAGVLLPDGTIHASAGTGGIVLVKISHGEQGKLFAFGSSTSTVPPTEEFPFLPIASILEMQKIE